MPSAEGSDLRAWCARGSVAREARSGQAGLLADGSWWVARTTSPGRASSSKAPDRTQDLLHRLRGSLGRWRHFRSCRHVLDLPPLEIREAPLSFVSMVSHRDLVMYLVAIRSLYAQIGEGAITIIDDGSLTAADAEILRRLLGRPQIIRADQIDTGACPRGGTWERLLHILDLSSSRYLIQLDSDTLTLAPVDEVINAYRSNRSFSLATRQGRQLVTLDEASRAAQCSRSQRVQIVAESSLSRLPGFGGCRYVRGCSAFAGFGKGAFTRAQAERLSHAMTETIGAKWREWGSEQVTSNLAIASAVDPLLLPYPRYATYDPSVNTDDSVFLHFIGTHRFRSDVYLRKSQDVVSRLFRSI